MANRRFHRPLGERPYRKLYLIVTEGTKTEPQYFGMFNRDNAIFRAKCLDSKCAGAPLKLLTRMKKYLTDEGLRSSDEAWIVVDKDSWTDEQLRALHQWSKVRRVAKSQRKYRLSFG